MKVAIIGAGAAGCFCAIELKRQLKDAEVTVYEAGQKPLAKVAITGGGRCNLTNSFANITSLQQAYPRGYRLMDKVFKVFGPRDTVEWFTKEGVKLVLQEDQCYFPASQDAMQIVRLLERRMRELGVAVMTSRKVTSITPETQGYVIDVKENDSVQADCVVVTAGGSPHASGLDFLKPLDLVMVPPVPSLFTFNLPGSPVRELMGTVVENVEVSLAGTKLKAGGPLLITHWGMSGPAVLRLSSYAARHLAEKDYNATLLVNWSGTQEDALRAELQQLAGDNQQKMVVNTHLERIPSRLWEYIIRKSGIREDIRWAELGSKGLNRLVETLQRDQYIIKGQTKFRDEFVTCGGVALAAIAPATLESRAHPGLYFAGEVLDVDAITGGFNLQAAWSTGFAVARSIALK